VGDLDLTLVKPEIEASIDRLYSKKCYGVILSGYYAAGVLSHHSVPHLLKMTWEAHDIPTFLKQAYRFDAVEGFGQEIEQAICWHEKRGMPDAAAWRFKFLKLQEQRKLREAATSSTPARAVLEEVEDHSRVGSNRFLELRPLAQVRTPKTADTNKANEDSYIISQTARVKLEQANNEHVRTLEVLSEHLRRCGKQVSSSRLIDAFAVLAAGPAIFEVKSITESNEREQVRHAISQLYEYRYLHQETEATLWLVFSREPFSLWLIDYLIKDRDVRVIWSDEVGRIKGPSALLLE